MCEWRYNWPSWRWVVSFTPRMPFLQVRICQYGLGKWLSETACQCGRCGGEIYLLSLVGIEPRFLVSLVAIRNGLSCDRCTLQRHYQVSNDRLCGLVVRVPGYRSWGPRFASRCYQIFWVSAGLERGPLSLVRIIEELLEWKSSGSGLENRY
jgi:hypothetical protein